MKYSLRPIAALLLMFAGIGSGCAEDGSAGQRAITGEHYADIYGAFLTGSGFSSGPEQYAAQEVTAPARTEGGDHFSRTEYLFLTAAAFYSGPEGYPFSW
ncbi:hypothetical protein [Aromatoleum petrolei]|uniref:Uncharacterized protein n=1 Tax=Aromatoleum petrolei TaxID=76116 RepID=A0ABX1MU58_9RHOO|nr:hypothetical protein [Aromatoleum petrolei]NMF91517.1 hypothetical protein [Aromatoleum petrolei]QTQ34535.1 Uncharacterized protein ToN1_03590 [Aromatoleum petrolei]